MLIFGVYKHQRIALEVPVAMTVRELKAMIQAKLEIPVDVYKRDNKVLVLSYAGGELDDAWIFSDLGLLPGTTLKVQLRDDIKPALYIRCSHNQEIISVFDDLTLSSGRISLVRSLASRKSGLPVGIFRLTTLGHREIFDHHCLLDYGVDVGQTILLEAWDGWSDFLNLSILGYTPQVMAQLDADEALARYQLKVALFIAAHFGHVDLARCVLKQGVRSDEPTGYHPARMWCQVGNLLLDVCDVAGLSMELLAIATMEQGHVDSLKCPVHEATLSGQVGVLRLFVNFDITCLKAKDGHGLEPLNLALRQKVKNCASFLLSKQWTRVHITKTFALHVATFTKLRKWCERAKERTLVKYGPGKSSLKRRSFNAGSLVIHGVFVDGFSRSPMTGRSKIEVLKEEKDNQEKDMRRLRFSVPVGELLGSTDDPEHYFRSVLAAQGARLRQRPGKNSLRWHKSSTSSMVSKAGSVAKDSGYNKPTRQVRPQLSVSNSESSYPRAPSRLSAVSETLDHDMVKLPPIMQNMRMQTMFQSLPAWSSADFKTTKSSSLKSKFESNGVLRYEVPNSLPALLNRPRDIIPGNVHIVKEATTNDTLSETIFSEQIKRDKNVSERNTLSDRRGFKQNRHTVASETPASMDDVFLEEESSSDSKKRKNRSSISVISSRIPSTRSSVPLPVATHEQSRRPFYYHQGVREDELIDAAMELVAKYKGNSSRERAIKSLSLANSFLEMPWLCRVRLALNVTRRSLKRNLLEVHEEGQV